MERANRASSTVAGQARWEISHETFAAIEAEYESLVGWASEYVAELGRKLVDEDLYVDDGPLLAAGAVSWLTVDAADDSFQYLVEMRKAWTQRGYLTVGQVRGVLNCLRAKVERNRHDAGAASFNDHFPMLAQLMRTARDAGLRNPQLRLSTADGYQLKIKWAGARSRNPGSIYVLERGAVHDPLNPGFGSSGAYFGKLDGETGEVDAKLQQHDGVLETLQAFEDNPTGEALRQAGVIGACCFCGRTLTTDESNAVGYGPICAEGWGLPWGKVPERSTTTEVREQFDAQVAAT